MEYGVLLGLISMVVFVHGCTDLGHVPRDPNGSEVDEMKVHFSEVVVYGHVKKIYKSGTPGVKNMDFDVVCSFKGNVQKKMIKVTGIAKKGAIDGCPTVSVEKDEPVVLFLKRLPASSAVGYEIEFSPVKDTEDLPIDVYLDDLGIYCGINITFGGEMQRVSECIDRIFEQEQCVAYEPPTTTTTTTTPAPTKSDKTVVVGPPVDETSEPSNDGPDNTNTNTNNGEDDTYVTKTEKPAKSSGDGKAGKAVDDGNNNAKQASFSVLALLLSFVVAAFV